MQLNDNAAFRVNIFGENLSNHRDFYYGDGFGVNPTLYYDLGDGDSLSISYEYLNQERLSIEAYQLIQMESLLSSLKILFSEIPRKTFRLTKLISYTRFMSTKFPIRLTVDFRHTITTTINYIKTCMYQILTQETEFLL